MIQELQQIFRSLVKSLEVLYVIEGIKPCARILVFEDEVSKAVDFLNRSKISYAISDFKVLKQTAQSDFYSDKSIKIQKNAAQKGHFFGKRRRKKYGYEINHENREKDGKPDNHPAHSWSV